MRLHIGRGRGRRPAGVPDTTSAERIVLLVVDDGNAAGALRRVADQLDSADWSVRVVRDAAEAATSGGRVDGVVLSLDGVDDARAVCRTVRGGRDPFIVAVTSGLSSPDCIRVLDAGADDYLSASIPGQELRLRVRNLLRRRVESPSPSPATHAAAPDATAR